MSGLRAIERSVHQPPGTFSGIVIESCSLMGSGGTLERSSLLGMRPAGFARLAFGERRLIDLTEEPDFEFPHILQRIVLPIVVTEGREHLRPLGSGFLLGPNVVVTARHVIEEVIADVALGRSQLWVIYLSDEDVPDADPVWGGPLLVKNVTMHTTGHSDLAVLTIPFPHINGRPAQPSGLPISFEPPEPGEQVLVLGYSDMTGGELDWANGDVPHTSLNHKLRAARGAVEEVHVNQRDSAMLSFPVLRASYPSPHGMSGGPVVNERGTVVGVVCSSFDDGGEGATVSYASLMRPLLGLRANPSLADPPQFTTIEALMKDGRLPRTPTGASTRRRLST